MTPAHLPPTVTDGPNPTGKVFGGLPVMTFRGEDQRRTFRRAAAVVGTGSSLFALSQRDKLAVADATANGLKILNYALTPEYLKADFYTRGLKGGAPTRRDLAALGHDSGTMIDA